MWRQGDIFMAVVDRIPEQAERLTHGVLAEGEITGHAHRIADPRLAELYEYGGQLYLRVIGDQAAIVHDEHHQIVLRQGCYRAWRQREFRPPVETSGPRAVPQGIYVEVED